MDSVFKLRAIGAVCAAACAAVSQALTYSVRIVDIPGTRYTQALKINNAGQVAGIYFVTGQGGFTFLMEPDGSYEVVPEKTDLLYDLTSDGTLYGRFSYKGSTKNYRWSRSIGFELIEDPKYYLYELEFVRANDELVEITDKSRETERVRKVFDSFLHTRKYGYVPMPIQFPSSLRQNLWGINNSGEIFGLSWTDPAWPDHLWIVHPKKGLRELELPPRDLVRQFSTNWFADDGSVAGHLTTQSPNEGRLCYWDPRGVWHMAEGDPDPNVSEIPLGMNAKGEIVGVFSSATKSWALRFTPDRDCEYLQDMLAPGQPPIDLGSASDVNERGQIVGTGTLAGRYVGYVLTPVPEPYMKR